jgi:hypothetical protein
MSVVGASPKENRLSIVIQIGIAVRGWRVLAAECYSGWKPPLGMRNVHLRGLNMMVLPKQRPNHTRFYSSYMT